MKIRRYVRVAMTSLLGCGRRSVRMVDRRRPTSTTFRNDDGSGSGRRGTADAFALVIICSFCLVALYVGVLLTAHSLQNVDTVLPQESFIVDRPAEKTIPVYVVEEHHEGKQYFN